MITIMTTIKDKMTEEETTMITIIITLTEIVISKIEEEVEVEVVEGEVEEAITEIIMMEDTIKAMIIKITKKSLTNQHKKHHKSIDFVH